MCITWISVLGVFFYQKNLGNVRYDCMVQNWTIFQHLHTYLSIVVINNIKMTVLCCWLLQFLVVVSSYPLLACPSSPATATESHLDVVLCESNQPISTGSRINENRIPQRISGTACRLASVICDARNDPIQFQNSDITDMENSVSVFTSSDPHPPLFLTALPFSCFFLRSISNLAKISLLPFFLKWRNSKIYYPITNVSDPYPDWIRIQSGQWIRIRIRIRNPDPGGQKWRKKIMFWSARCSFLRAGGFFCSLDFLYGGLGKVCRWLQLAQLAKGKKSRP